MGWWGTGRETPWHPGIKSAGRSLGRSQAPGTEGLTVRWLDDLAELSPEQLELLLSQAGTFARPEWYRLISGLDLAAIMGGAPELRWLAAFDSSGLAVGLCPVLRARGAGIYFLHSIRQHFFEHWIEEAIRLNPDAGRKYGRIARIVGGLGRLLEWTGSRLDDALLILNPLSYRSTIATSPLAGPLRGSIVRALIGEARAESNRLGRVLWMPAIEDDDADLIGLAERSGLARTFLLHDNRLDLTSFPNFDAWLGSFSRTTRRAFQKDIRRCDEAGVRFTFTDRFTDRTERMAELHRRTYARYGESFLRHDASFWSRFEAEVARPGAGELIEAWLGDELIGFSALLKDSGNRSLWTWRIGRTDDPRHDRIPFYFGLTFYGPIRRALELGYRTVWFGPASYEAKSVRGAQVTPLWSCWSFPRVMERSLLSPYLRLFGRMTRKEIESTLVRRETEGREDGSPNQNAQRGEAGDRAASSAAGARRAA